MQDGRHFRAADEREGLTLEPVDGGGLGQTIEPAAGGVEVRVQRPPVLQAPQRHAGHQVQVTDGELGGVRVAARLEGVVLGAEHVPAEVARVDVNTGRAGPWGIKRVTGRTLRGYHHSSREIRPFSLPGAPAAPTTCAGSSAR